MDALLASSGEAIADMAAAYEARGDYERAASEYRRAAMLYARGRQPGPSAAAAESAHTCQRAAATRSH